MLQLLPIGVKELLSGRVESTRLELKATWSDPIANAVVKTVCAFANDLYNLNGGYIVLGAAEQDGVAVRPVGGLPVDRLDEIQKKIRGQCNRLDPPYQPLMAPEVIDGKHVLVIHAPASDTRPHHAPDGPKGPRVPFVRVGPETVRADREPLRTALYQQTARVPYDDRRAADATVDDLRESRVREFLRDVRSGLPGLQRDAHGLYESMRLLSRVNGHHVPRNVALLFFADEPTRWFPGAFIDVVRFGSDDGTTLEERRFRGPLHEQVRDCLSHLESFTVRHLRKRPEEVQVEGFVSYPLMALREALVNAIYHRSYEPSVPDGTKVYLHADRIEVISYPGPAAGLSADDFAGGRVRPMPARNRRVGELLKDLGLAEERSTGIPKVYRSMRDNGSPEPTFDFDTDRSYFRVTLPAHPEYVTFEALTKAAYLQTTGDYDAAIRHLRESLTKRPDSVGLATALIQALGRSDHIDMARQIAADFPAEAPTKAQVLLSFADVLVDTGPEHKAEVRDLISALPTDVLQAQDAMGAAILARRAGQPEKAHQLFDRAGALVASDVKSLDEFAQTKLKLVKSKLRRRRGRNLSTAQREARERLLREARDMFERVLQMDAPRMRRAWAWFNLASVLDELGEPLTRQIHALEQATRLMPESKKFSSTLARTRDKRGE